MNLETTAQEYAKAEADLIAAKDVHGAAIAKADAIRDRITDLNTRIDFLRNRRVAGNGSRGDQDELILLGGDTELLQKSLAEAQSAADRVQPITEQAKFDQAQYRLQRAEFEAKLDLLKSKATEVSGLLLTLMLQIQEAGQADSKNLNMVWRPPRELHRLVANEYPAHY